MDVPWLSAHETCNWACHQAAHNTDLGDDFFVPAGTPIPAPVAGTLRNKIRFEFPPLYIAYFTPDGSTDSFEFMHLSKFAKRGHYVEGQTIGRSGGRRGAIGSGHATGEHLHVNAVIGGRLAPVRTLIALLTAGTTTAGTGTVTPINATKRKNDMTTLYHDVSTKPLLFALAGDSPGTPANWLTTTDSGLAKSWAASHGNSCGLSHGSFIQFGVDYTAPLTIKP